MRDDENDLLDAVDNLTKEQRRRETQDLVVDGKVAGTQRVEVVLPPLLDQLNTAIRSSMGGSTSGAALAHEGAVLDVDALFMFIKIASQIKDWCYSAGVVPANEPGVNLRAWYVATLKRPMSDEVESYYVKVLGQWAGQIKGKLDPWREKDLPDACPVCGAKSWWRDGAEYYRPLVIRYKPTGADLIQQARGVCRSCEKTWTVRELAYELEQAEAKDNEGEVA